MASLQARHQRSCPLYPWTTFADATKANGCTCKPMYHLNLIHNGQRVRKPVGLNRRVAQDALRVTEGDVASRTYRVVQDITFDEWAQQWFAGLTGKPGTRQSYRWTIQPARRTFGRTKVRDLTTADVRRFLDAIRDEHNKRRPAEVTPATLARHLRVLGACLEAARREGYATENPVRLLDPSSRPKPGKKRPSYFTDGELARLWPELADRPVLLALCKTAVATGMRFGELVALDWSDVALVDREVHVRRTVDAGGTVTTPKSGEARAVDLTPPAWQLLADWYTVSGGEGRVFELEHGARLTPHYALRWLYAAMERAGIPRVGEGGRARTFHSFRHTFARIALEAGAEISWVKEQLGHSSITLTVDLYGSWSRVAKKAQAERLADAFTL